MKAQIDEDREELKEKVDKLDKREKEIIDLEKKQKELEKREKMLAIKEEDTSEAQLMADKDKKAARDKQTELVLKEKALEKKQIRLQKMIDAQNS